MLRYYIHDCIRDRNAGLSQNHLLFENYLKPIVFGGKHGPYVHLIVKQLNNDFIAENIGFIEKNGFLELFKIHN